MALLANRRMTMTRFMRDLNRAFRSLPRSLLFKRETSTGRIDRPVKIIFLVTVDWAFWSRRRALAKAAQAAGMQVVVVTRTETLRKQMEGEGFKVIEWRNDRRSINPLGEAYSLLQLILIYLRERPDLVHHVAIKPAVYGGIAARLTGVGVKVSMIIGLGYVFTSASLKARLLRPLVRLLLWVGLGGRNALTIFQNDYDLNELVKRGVVSWSKTLIQGSGVDVGVYRYKPEPSGTPVVAMISRLLWDKGVGEFVEAGRILKKRGVDARFILVGEPDGGSAAAVPLDRIRDWAEEGVVEVWGHGNDIPEVLGITNIVCLPSYYGEGLPRVLVEAASCGRAIVTTDSPGCRDIVKHGENGLLVPPRHSESLAEAIETLILHPDLREYMGKRGRERVITEFLEEIIVAKTMNAYRRLLYDRGA